MGNPFKKVKKAVKGAKKRVTKEAKGAKKDVTKVTKKAVQHMSKGPKAIKKADPFQRLVDALKRGK